MCPFVWLNYWSIMKNNPTNIFEVVKDMFHQHCITGGKLFLSRGIARIQINLFNTSHKTLIIMSSFWHWHHYCDTDGIKLKHEKFQISCYLLKDATYRWTVWSIGIDIYCTKINYNNNIYTLSNAFCPSIIFRSFSGVP